MHTNSTATESNSKVPGPPVSIAYAKELLESGSEWRSCTETVDTFKSCGFNVVAAYDEGEDPRIHLAESLIQLALDPAAMHSLHDVGQAAKRINCPNYSTTEVTYSLQPQGVTNQPILFAFFNGAAHVVLPSHFYPAFDPTNWLKENFAEGILKQTY